MRKPLAWNKIDSRFSREVTAAMFVYRTMVKKVFGEFDSIVVQNFSDILLLFCAPTCPPHHRSATKVLVFERQGHTLWGLHTVRMNLNLLVLRPQVLNVSYLLSCIFRRKWFWIFENDEGTLRGAHEERSVLGKIFFSLLFLNNENIFYNN